MDIKFEWLGRTVSASARKTLERHARASLREFFRLKVVPEITLVALRAARGKNNGEIFLHTLAEKPEYGYRTDFVPVSVFLEGTQGLICLMGVQGLSSSELLKLIDGGPYKTKPKVEQEVLLEEVPKVLSPTEVFVSTVVETAPLDPVPPMVAVKTVGKVVQAPRITPQEILEHAGDSPEKINRLKATLATIISREVDLGKLSEVPNTLQVPVTRITQAIMEHMKLPSNPSGNYRGTIANFYASRINLFALKWNTSLVADDRYDDWVFDCTLVLDFIGGADKLACLTREREQEVRQRLIEESTTREPPPVAAKVEAAVENGFLPDNSIFELAMRTLEGRRLAEAEVVRAEENMQSFQEIVDRLSAKLMTAQAELDEARVNLSLAKRRRDEFVFAPAVLEKVREAKARLDKLANDLGL